MLFFFIFNPKFKYPQIFMFNNYKKEKNFFSDFLFKYFTNFITLYLDIFLKIKIGFNTLDLNTNRTNLPLPLPILEFFDFFENI